MPGPEPFLDWYRKLWKTKGERGGRPRSDRRLPGREGCQGPPEGRSQPGHRWRGGRRGARGV